MTELGLLAEQLDIGERTLRRAVNQGVLRATRSTPRRLKMPVAEKRYARHAWPLLAALRGALRTEGNVRFALLFGSAARGDDTPESDVDLIVEMADGSLDRTADLSAKLEMLAGRRTDLVPLSDAEATPGLLADAIAEGRVLVDRDGLWPALHRREEELRRRALAGEKRRRDSALARIDRMLAV